MITITLNGQLIELPAEVNNIEQLLAWKHIPTVATAVAINGKVIPADKQSTTILNPLDSVIVISAAYGG